MHVWIFQSGEPLHSDNDNARPMRCMNLANTLVERGHSVLLLSSSFYHQKKYHRSKKYEVIKINKSLKILLVPSPGYEKNFGISRLFDHLMLAYNLKKILNLQTKLPDVAFIGYPPIETAFILITWLKKKKIPCLLDVKDQWPSIIVDKVPWFMKTLMKVILIPYYIIAKKTLRESSGICAMSKSFVDWSLNFSNRKKCKFDIIAPLTSPNDQLTAQEEEQAYFWWLKKNVLQNNVFRVMFVGSFSQAFDFDLILKAAKILNDKSINCEFIFCGDGELDYKLKSKSKKFKNIKIVEWIDSSKIIVLSKLCSAYIAPYKNNQSFINSIPNKIIDSFRLGKPLLSPLKGEVENLIITHKVGLVYSDSFSLANKIKLLIADRYLYENISNNSKKLYDEKFEFYKVYNNLINNLENLNNEEN